MLVRFKNRKTEKEFCDLKLLKRKWGEIQAGLIARRIKELEAADNLEILRSLPQLTPMNSKEIAKGKSLSIFNIPTGS